MKKVGLYLCTLFLMGCQPEDNKLNVQNKNVKGQNQTSPTNLRVGSYGLPIFTAQTLEQVGSLISQCSESNQVMTPYPSAQVRGVDVVVKTCRLREVIRAKGLQSTEKWDISLFLRTSDNKIIEAIGRMTFGQDFGQFKSQLVQLKYDDKEFRLLLDPETGKFQINLDAAGQTQSDSDSLSFTYELDTQGTMVQESQQLHWKFDELTYGLNLLNRPHTFLVTSSDLELVWIKSTCAEMSGVVSTMDLTSNTGGQIRLTPVKAELIVESDGRPWSQKYAGCLDRDNSVRNFEFLFY